MNGPRAIPANRSTGGSVQWSRAPLATLLWRLGLVALVYSLLRVLFWAYNRDLFPHPPAAAFIGGIRFDLFAIAWLFLPWVLLVLIQPRPGRVFGRVQLGLFLVINAVALFFNCVDLGYYAFSLKRSTADFLQILTTGDDTANLAPAFVRDYWHILLIYLGCLALLAWGYRRIGRMQSVGNRRWTWQLGWRLAAIGLLVLASRGGVQLIPLQPLDGARYGGASYLPVVLNTPYTMLMSLGKPTLVQRAYMPKEEADVLWPVVHMPEPALPFAGEGLVPGPARPNVVVIVLESFSALYSARLGGGEGYMPFLDSLMDRGLNCTRAYANGRRSIDGIPAILASMPELMDEAFITSPYASLPFTSLANVLGPEGYASSFYHGGRNGTMGFDGFARSAGFQRYVGLNEYPNGQHDHDGHWGIRDRPFLQFWAQQLAQEQEPFLSTVFTLSSHHPYQLPKDEEARFAGGTQAIHPTLRYTDEALRQFFATARQMPWYRNTLFVITADHTADLERSGQHYDKAIDYWVPLLYFAPWWTQGRTIDFVTQHIDVLPTVLDLIGHPRPYFSFGRGAFREGRSPIAISASNGIYLAIDATGRQLKFDGERSLSSTGPTGGPANTSDQEPYLKAAIQQFNDHLLRGQLVTERPVP